MGTVRRAWADLARDLYEFSDQAMWKTLGYDTFEEWLEGPDVSLDRRWVYQLIAQWRELVVNLGAEPSRLTAVEPSKVQEILPAVRRGQVSLEQALSDCEILSRADLRQRYGAGAQNGTSGEIHGTAYDPAAERQFAKCHACGSTYEVRT
ncbi:hypothetical protein NBH00_05045 [Paraconexibacter antarcticus]|uniref:Uncharacterized protein n=1 Tax=Paraconexibacter antarcticus TaxID=2949664 RepID=A0ABY5DV81_9ACTN|nr:hypothetical protein [Paraconexibacter antarcticus]UTI65576.1 hypothetical protein NBH00_05045 [Paraconexibacter antarcticus]